MAEAQHACRDFSRFYGAPGVRGMCGYSCPAMVRNLRTLKGVLVIEFCERDRSFSERPLQDLDPKQLGYFWRIASHCENACT